MDKKDFKATLKEMPVEEAMAALIEQHGEEAIATAIAPKEEPKVELPAEIKEQIDALTSQLTEAQITISKMTDEAGEKAERAAVVASIEGIGIDASEEMVATILGISEDHRDSVLETIGHYKSKADKLAEQLTIETPGATIESDEDKDGIVDLDGAVAYIQKRDGIEDIDEALAKAQTEFPTLYKV